MDDEAVLIERASAGDAHAFEALVSPHLDAANRVAVTQLRAHPPARALMARRIAAGNSKPEALRVLKRHLADAVYAAMCSDEQAGNTATAGQPAAT